MPTPWRAPHYVVLKVLDKVLKNVEERPDDIKFTNRRTKSRSRRTSSAGLRHFGPNTNRPAVVDAENPLDEADRVHTLLLITGSETQTR